MNRPIKFRAWCAVEKRFLTPHEASAMIFESGSCWAAGNLGENYKDDYPYAVEWMQFTGLTDKSGVEIYDGDICRAMFRERGGVYFLTGQIIMDDYMWCIQCTDGEIYSINRIHNVEIIGNIFQSPSLLQS